MTEPTSTTARRRPQPWIIAGGAALLVVVAVAATLAATYRPAATPAAEQAAPSATSASARPKLLGDPVALDVCPEILRVQATQEIYTNPDAMQTIGEQAAASADLDVALNGQMLAERAKLARAARGDDDELNTSLQMGGAAVNLATVCIKGGFKA